MNLFQGDAAPGSSDPAKPASPAAARARAAQSIEGYTPLQVAACVTLVELACADDDFTRSERDHILDTLKRRFSLSDGDAAELIEIAEKEREESTDLWRYTNQINEHCTNDEKVAVIEEIWRLVYADGTLDGHEDHLMHRLGKLLNLNHPTLIDAKMRVLEERRGG